MEKTSKKADSNVVAKAGLWYTVCNFLFRGMTFLTTPLFSRLLTKTELGDFSNYASWISILTVITAFDLQTSIIRSKLEHDDDMDSYVWSILSFTTIWTLVCYAVVFCFPQFFMNIFGTEMKYIHVMFIYLLFTPAYQMLITKHRAYYKYKSFVAITGIAIVSSSILSLTLVLLFDDKYAGRLLGNYIPYIVLGVIIYFYIAIKGKKIKLCYWKYACVICLPLVPHVLSMYLLGSSDKIILTSLSGSEYTAIYSIAYSCYHIATLLFNSMNQAWAPWLLEKLHYKEYNVINRTSKVYILSFLFLSLGILIFVPEIIYILGGKQYEAAIYCLPPLIASCVFQFVYTMYVNIEFYEKKTVGVALATITATVINIALNYILIPLNPENGHIIASYTTLAGYCVLFVLHYFLVKRLKMEFVYSTKFVLLILGETLLVSLLMNVIYSLLIVRIVIIIIYFIVCIALLKKYKTRIMKILKSK